MAEQAKPDTSGGNPPDSEDWRLWLPILFDADEMNQQLAAEVLGDSEDPAAIPPLLAALEAVRGMIAGGGPVARALVSLRHLWRADIFIGTLTDSRGYVRRASAEALGWIKDLAALDPLISALRQDEHFGVRLEAAWALGQLGDGRAVYPLVEALKDQDANVRRSAVEALARLHDPMAREPLERLLMDEDLGVRLAAREALSYLWPEAG
jgi:HEAT repeat protein